MLKNLANENYISARQSIVDNIETFELSINEVRTMLLDQGWHDVTPDIGISQWNEPLANRHITTAEIDEPQWPRP